MAAAHLRTCLTTGWSRNCLTWLTYSYVFTKSGFGCIPFPSRYALFRSRMSATSAFMRQCTFSLKKSAMRIGSVRWEV